MTKVILFVKESTFWVVDPKCIIIASLTSRTENIKSFAVFVGEIIYTLVASLSAVCSGVSLVPSGSSVFHSTPPLDVQYVATDETEEIVSKYYHLVWILFTWVCAKYFELSELNETIERNGYKMSEKTRATFKKIPVKILSTEIQSGNAASIFVTVPSI